MNCVVVCPRNSYYLRQDPSGGVSVPAGSTNHTNLRGAGGGGGHHIIIKDISDIKKNIGLSYVEPVY